jgi:hypothetical protein
MAGVAADKSLFWIEKTEESIRDVRGKIDLIKSDLCTLSNELDRTLADEQRARCNVMKEDGDITAMRAKYLTHLGNEIRGREVALQAFPPILSSLEDLVRTMGEMEQVMTICGMK